MKKLLVCLALVIGGIAYAYGKVDVPADESLSGSATPEVIKIEGFCDAHDNYAPCNNFKLCYGEGCIRDFYTEHAVERMKACRKHRGGNACTQRKFGEL